MGFETSDRNACSKSGYKLTWKIPVLLKTLNKSIQTKSHLYFLFLFPILPPTSHSHFLFPLSGTANIRNGSNLFPGYIGVWNVLSIPTVWGELRYCIFGMNQQIGSEIAKSSLWSCTEANNKALRLSGLWDRDCVPSL